MIRRTAFGLSLSLLPLLVAAPGCSSDAEPDPDDTGARADGGMTTADAEPVAPDAEPVPPDAAPNGFVLSGDVTGEEVPADAEVIAIWAVWTSPGDHAAKWGDGTSSGSQFTVVLEEAPPPGFAMNDFGGGRRIGIGFLALVPTGTDVPDGVLDPEQVTALGLARTPIIWREGEMGGDLDWSNAFEEATYQCGRCVPADDDETFDTFEPIDCAEVEIDSSAETVDCNFT